MIRRDTLPNVVSTTSEFTASVLIIEDARQVRDFYGRELLRAGYTTAAADAARVDNTLPQVQGYAAILLDVHLPGIERGTVKGIPGASPFGAMVVNGRLTVRVTVEALEPAAGASAAIESTVGRDERAGAAAATLPEAAHPSRLPAAAGHARGAVTEPPHSTAHRWATYVLSVCRASHDIKTLDDWARHVGTSHTTLRQICRILGIRPHDARNLARALCAMIHAGQEHCPPSVLLDVADTRTLKTFLRRAGPGFRSASDMSSIHRFLDTQQFVESHHQGLRILRQLLTAALPLDMA
jgi:CheY-like chemotaxis protein